MTDEPQANFNLSSAKRALLEAMRKEERIGAALEPTIQPSAIEGPAPLSVGQEELWLLAQLDGASQAYNVPITYRLRGRLDVGALKRALNRLVERHAILRTRFTVIDGRPMQVIDPQLELDIEIRDLTGLQQADSYVEVLRQATEEGQRAFDLEHGPLLRATLWRLDQVDQVLQLNLHHIVFDEWSQGVLYRELEQIYASELGGYQVQLPKLPVQYADYAAWQRKWVQSDVCQAKVDYWKGILSSAPVALGFPWDNPRSRQESYRGTTLRRKLPAGLLYGLKQISRESQTTLFMTLLAGFYSLIYRYTGQSDLVVGTPVTSRRQPELEGLVGYFLNTLALRLSVDGGEKFADLLQRLRRATLEGIDQSDAPFEKVLEAVSPHRLAGVHPLYQVMYVFHPQRQQRLALSGLDSEPINLDFGHAKFDLTLYVGEIEDGLEARLEYKPELLDAGSAERLLVHYQRLLEGIALNPATSVGRLPLLGQEERDQLTAWNATATMYPRHACVHELVEAQAARTPQAMAVIAGGELGESLTYGELNARANRLAHFLRRLGIGPDMPVGLNMPRSSELLVAILAVLKAGGACLPLDPSYPTARLEFMCLDSRMVVLLTRTGVPQVAPSGGSNQVSLDEIAAELELEVVENPEQFISPDNLAYILYTSGSTGEPKGVMMPHRPLVNLVAWQLQHFATAAQARTLQLTSLSFDVSFQEILTTWSAGGALVLVNEATRQDLGSLVEYIIDQRVERLFLPFVALQALVEAAVTRRQYPARLREVFTAGEQLQITPEIAEFFAQQENCTLHNHYGPTEAHVVSAYTLRGPPRSWPPLPPIGRPIANTRLYVLNGEMQPVPIGVVGEIYLGGDCLARGYSLQPELTADRFVPSPFEPPGERLYRSGDLGRFLADGNLQYLGRADGQVKIRGFRVEPGEVEAALARHPQVRQAAVVAHRSAAGDVRLLAWVVLQVGMDTSAEELRSYLMTSLPEYMIPAAVLFVETLPLTSSGKLDRLELAARAAAKVENQSAEQMYLEPRDELERHLCHIWEIVLGVARVGVRDDFFALGGHSLLAVRLFARIEKDLGRRLPLSSLFQASTVTALAEKLRQSEQPGDWSPLVAIQPNGARPPFFCVHNFGGEVINLKPLAHALGGDQPFFGLQARGLDGLQAPHATIPEMGEYYLQAVRAAQPYGPYYLGGYCFGGVVAYEIACRLQALGERVALLALIDAYAPGRAQSHQTAWRPGRWANFLVNLPIWLRDFYQLDGDERRVVVFRRLKRVGKGMARRMGLEAEMTPREIIGDHADVVEAPLHVQELMELHIVALVNYFPPEYDGRITLFRSRRLPLFTSYDPDVGWGRLAHGGVERHIIPGAHHNVLRSPYVTVLAQELRASLRQVQGDFS